MKKILCFVLILTLLFALVSCSNPNDSADSDSINTPENDQAPSSTTTSSESMPNSEPNQKIDFTACLQTLLEGYKWNPQSIIPEKLSPDYTANFINTDNINNNYSSFIPVTNIPQNGIGEQWNMIIENLSEYQIFFNVLSVIDNLSSLSVAAFNNYIDKNPSDTAQYQFQEGIYSVTISCTQDSIDYVLDYTTTLTTIGEQSIQISLSMNTLTQVKIVRIQIGDANAVKYTVDNNKYSFAIKYLGIRRAYFELNTNSDGSLSGHIYEYLTTNSMELASVADFYITDEYLTVVGNKASDMIGFDGTICEL